MEGYLSTKDILYSVITTVLKYRSQTFNPFLKPLTKLFLEVNHSYECSSMRNGGVHLNSDPEF